MESPGGEFQRFVQPQSRRFYKSSSSSSATDGRSSQLSAAMTDLMVPLAFTMISFAVFLLFCLICLCKPIMDTCSAVHPPPPPINVVQNSRLIVHRSPPRRSCGGFCLNPRRASADDARRPECRCAAKTLLRSDDVAEEV